MRTCPFSDCQKRIPDSMFACRNHWFSLSAPEKAEIYAAYNEYMAGKISMEELRQRQQAVLGNRGQA